MCGASGAGRSPIPDRPSSGACGPGSLPTGCGCGVYGLGDPSPTPQRALLRACFARCGGGTMAPGGGGLLPGCGASGVRRSPMPDRLSFEACCRRPPPTGCRCGECGLGDPSSNPQRALLRADFARCGGGTRAPGGGASCPGVWGVRGRALSHPRPPVPWGVRSGPTTYWLLVRGMWAWVSVTRPRARAIASWLCALWGDTSCLCLEGSGLKRSLIPDRPSFGACGGGPLPTDCRCLGCGRGGPVVLGTFLRAVVRHVGFAAASGRGGLAPVLVPWLWSAACLSGVPLGPALVRRASSSPAALGATVGFPVAVAPSPTRGAVAPGFTGWLRGARRGWRRTGLIVLAAGPCRGKGALGALRVVPVWGPAMGSSLAGPSSSGLGLRALRWFGVFGPGH